MSMVYHTCKQEILYILYWEVFKMLLRDSTGRSVEFHHFEGKLDADLWVM